MKKEKTSIVFTGDIGFDRYMDRKWEDKNLLSETLFEFFRNADHACLNVEGAICALEEDESRSAFFHAMNPESYEVFEDGKMIFYSLGNFIFDTDYQRAHLYTDVGVLLKLSSKM